MGWIQQISSHSVIAQWSVIVLGCALLSTVLKWTQEAVLRRARRLSDRTKTQIDDLFVTAFTRTSHLLLFFVTLAFFVLWMNPTPTARHLALITIRFSFVIQIFLWLDGALNFAVDLRIQRKGNGRSGAMDLLRGVGRMFLLALAVMLCLDVFGVNITALVAGLGIGGVAVALAMQNILSDLFSSLSIVMDKPFEVGDFVVAGSEMGTIERIGLKTTRVRSLSGEQLVFPNSNLLQSRIRNFQRMSERRVAFDLNVDYSVDAARLKSIPRFIQAAVTKLPLTRFERSHLAGFGEAGYRFETVYWVTDADYNKHMDLQQTLFFQIVEELGRQKIPMGVPGRQIRTEPVADREKENPTERPARRGNQDYGRVADAPDAPL